MSLKIPRRTVLKGLGASIALPFLDAMMPSAGAAPAEPSPRLAFLYLGTGWNTRELFPKTPGANYEVTRILKPLQAHRNEFTCLQGMGLEFGGGHDGDNTFLTGSDCVFVARNGGEFKNSISCDQIAAKTLGKDTRYPSLELSERRGTGFGGQGLHTLAWSGHGVPLASQNDPHVFFNRLFGADGPGQREENERRFRQRRSVLDGIRAKAKEMEKKLGKADRSKLEQYFVSIREVEKQLEREIAWSKSPKPRPDTTGMGDFSTSMHPDKNPFDYEAYARLMYDLIALAWQNGSTRVVTYVVRRELKSHYPGLQSFMDYHSLTHHSNDPKKLNELARIDTIYMDHFAAFLKRLKSIKEADGSLLDRCMIGVSSGMGIGHSKTQLPTIFAGGKALGIKHQGFVKYEKDTPLTNLWSTMLERAGVPGARKIRGSTGVLPELL